MRKCRIVLTLLAVVAASAALAQESQFFFFDYPNSNFEIKASSFKGEAFHEIFTSEISIAGESGFPNIPTVNRYVAVPHGAKANIEIVSFKEKTLKDIRLAPSVSLPLDTDDSEIPISKDSGVYECDDFYPKDIASISEIMEIRNVGLMMLCVNPFRYNPVRKELKVYQDIKVKISFTGGERQVKSSNSKTWDDFLKGIVANPDFFENNDYCSEKNKLMRSGADGCDYLIVTPDNDGIKSWADTLSLFRNEQGVLTKVMKISEISQNHPDSLKAFFKNAIKTWTIKPSAVLLLGDYDENPEKGIVSYALKDHPQDYEPYMADNKMVAFSKSLLPEIAIARIPAANAAQAELMVKKVISYETHPSTDSAYYMNPITSMGFQENRWFQLCSEVVGGYFRSIGKNPTRLNAIHSGIPGDVWSTATNTASVTNYFGPKKMNYIPEKMSHLTEWNALPSDISEAIDKGAFIVQHRDHGTYQGWGEPYFRNSDINDLNNKDLCFVMSNNCQTGAFNYGGDCLAERFLRTEHGAVGVIAASEVSYSFVNDTYVWGCYDYLWPDFIPDYGTQDIDYQYPAFANAYGKFFLNQSSWPSNSSMKILTYNLFHYFGDAFLQLNSEFPKTLDISHLDTIYAPVSSVEITAEINADVCLSIEGKPIAVAKGVGKSMSMEIPFQERATTIKVTATKQNRLRYAKYIAVVDTVCHPTDDVGYINVFPNPAKDIVNIESGNILEINIYNIVGQKMRCVSAKTPSNLASVDLSGLPSGTYLLEVRCASMTHRKKMEVRR